MIELEIIRLWQLQLQMSHAIMPSEHAPTIKQGRSITSLHRCSFCFFRLRKIPALNIRKWMSTANHCSFARDCRATIGLQVTQADPWSAFDSQLGVPFFIDIIYHHFIDLLYLDAKESFIFRGIQPHPDACRRHSRNEFAPVILRAKVKHKEAISKRCCNL